MLCPQTSVRLGTLLRYVSSCCRWTLTQRPTLVNIQRIRGCGGLSLKWDICNVPLPSRLRGHLRRGGRETVRAGVMDDSKGTVSSKAAWSA